MKYPVNRFWYSCLFIKFSPTKIPSLLKKEHVFLHSYVNGRAKVCFFGLFVTLKLHFCDPSFKHSGIVVVNLSHLFLFEVNDKSSMLKSLVSSSFCGDVVWYELGCVGGIGLIGCGVGAGIG